MLKRNKINKNKFKMYGLIILFIGIIICLYDLGHRYYKESLNSKKVDDFINDNLGETEVNNENKNFNTNEEYIGVLEIPNIDLKRGFYNIDSINNDVSKGIQIIEHSDMPNVKNGTLILAAHSGNGQVSYFKNLYKLLYEDIVYVYYNKYKYKYKLIDIYEVEKNGIVEIKKEKNITSLVLITCSKNNKTKQTIYIGKLIEKL